MSPENVLKKGLPLLIFLLFSQVAFCQTRTITGKVTDENGNSLPNATIRSGNDPSLATASDLNGDFLIEIPTSVRKLIFSYVGFRDTTLEISSNTIRLVMKGLKSLNEIVVIGYGTQQKKNLTGAITTVNSDDFQEGSITTPEQLIAGKVSGVSITSNGGSPGSGSVIRIRGGASLNGSNDPLIVIDGIPMSGNNIYGASNSLSLINPNDIESFTILKDAASTAIYGSRASNGVILITTKKGRAGKPVFNFSTVGSISTIVKEASVMSAKKFRAFVDQKGSSTYDGVHTFQSLMGNATTNWQQEIYQKALSTDNNLSMSGSLKKMPYRISAGYVDQEGLLKTDHLQRFTAGISLSPHLLNDHLKIQINLKGALSKTRFANNAAIGAAAYFDPTQPVHAPSPYGNYYEWASTDPISGAVTLNKLAPRNPLALLDLYHNLSNVKRSYGNIQLDYSLPFLPELHANYNLGYDIARGKGTVKVPAYAAQNFLDSGQSNQYSNKIGNIVSEFYLNYNKTISYINSNINATVGYGYYNNLSTNYIYPSYRANGNEIPGSAPNFTKDQPDNTLISYYGRLIYTLNTRYILSATIRTDGSSRFGPLHAAIWSKNRWGTFPSLAFTWRINQEKFLRDSKTISDLKLRLSYGVTGNQDGIYDYSYLGVYSISDNASQVLFGNTYYNMGTPAAYDSRIKWEQTASFNAGLDYGFLDDRIRGSIDVYFKKTKDLLNNIPIPAGSNFSSNLLTNVGNVENKGIEFSIHATPVKNNRFTWDLGFNASYNENNITNLTATKDPTFPGSFTGDGIIQINSVGYNANAFYVYHQQYDGKGQPIEGVFADLNNDGIINQDDRYRYKSPFPTYVFGFTTEFTLNRWSLSTVLRANTGNYMYNGLAAGAVEANVFNQLGYLANVLDDVLKSQFKNYGLQLSDYYVQNASFLKMDNIGIGYDAGLLFSKKAHLRINANCQNVFTITRYDGLDPEIYGGIDNSLYPRPRIFSLGLNLQF